MIHKTKEELRTETNSMIEEFLKTSEIKYLSRKKERSPDLTGLITIYSYDKTEVIL